MKKYVKQFPAYNGEMPPPEAEELWTDIDLHNFFYSSGFIRPKAKGGKTKKVTQAMLNVFYDILGAKRGGKLHDVRLVYRQLALKYHPDKNSGSPDATAKFQGITEAYSAICQHLEGRPK